MATKQEIKEWLKRQGHNEEWFAEQLNIPNFLIGMPLMKKFIPNIGMN